MDRHGLTTADVADLLLIEVNTVHAWLSVGQTRPIPDRQFKMLKRLVKQKSK